MGRIKITGDYRVCRTCGMEKHISEYSFRNVERRQYYCDCKECSSRKWREKDRLRYQNDEEFRLKRVENTRRYRLNHPDRCRKTNLKCRYGITEYDVEWMKIMQGHRCAICGVEERFLKKGLVIDHDHKTGKVRGLLCDTCNKFLGFYEKHDKECSRYLYGK